MDFEQVNQSKKPTVRDETDIVTGVPIIQKSTPRQPVDNSIADLQESKEEHTQSVVEETLIKKLPT